MYLRLLTTISLLSLLSMLALPLRIWILRHHILKLAPQCLDRTELIANLPTLVSPHQSQNAFQLTAMTPSIDRFSLLILANTCSKLYSFVSASIPHKNQDVRHQSPSTTPRAAGRRRTSLLAAARSSTTRLEAVLCWMPFLLSFAGLVVCRRREVEWDRVGSLSDADWCE